MVPTIAGAGYHRAMFEMARLLVPMVLAVVAVVAIDRVATLRGLQLPGLRPVGAPGWMARRALGLGALGVALYLGVFAPLGALGVEIEPDWSAVPPARLFALHAVFAVALALYLGAGLSVVEGRRSLGRLARLGAQQLGLATARPAREVGIGVACGLLGWVAVIVLLSLLALGALAIGFEGAVPEHPPAMIVWLAALPWGVRLAVSLSAGLVEEAFFRGLLQPRVGIGASSLLFVLAHAGYGQPLLLIGVTLLSLGFAALTRWRRTIWAAIAAHALFDAVQLLVIIPLAIETLES
ncbi:MAG TPA: CPBP family intramembrane glutamic endopeptidase [Thermoanaerobaculia bacterium]|nr:CPBP family intramembrane glutamic endopeptidase [Thermoanaerobaculia bacterium]